MKTQDAGSFARLFLGLAVFNILLSFISLRPVILDAVAGVYLLTALYFIFKYFKQRGSNHGSKTE